MQWKSFSQQVATTELLEKFAEREGCNDRGYASDGN